MVTVRSYWNAAEAAIGKSLLDDYGILCALADENAHIYTYCASPVRLVVNEAQAEWALQILNGHPEAAAETDAAGELPIIQLNLPTDRENRNPWEFLAIAFLFLLPGFCFLQIRHPKIAGRSPGRNYPTALVDVIHFLGWLGIAAGICLIALYVYTRLFPVVDDGPLPEERRDEP